MEQNKQLLKTILLITAALTVLSGAFLLFIRLDEPVVFDHYYDLALFANERDSAQRYTLPFGISYIINTDESRQVVKVSFPEEPDLQITVQEEDPMGRFGRIAKPYQVRILSCQITGGPGSIDLSGKSLTRAVLRFSDGKELTVKIGRISFYQDAAERPLLEFSSSGSASEGSRITTLITKEALTVQKLTSPSLGPLRDRIRLTVNGQPADSFQGLPLQKDSALRISSETLPGKDPIGELALFDIHPQLDYQGADGQAYSIRVGSVGSVLKDHGFFELYRYLRAKGAL